MSIHSQSQNPWTLSRILYLFARLILGGIFIYASLDKVLHPAAFAEAVFNYQILPGALINMAALILPWLELLLGVFLIGNIWMPGTAVIANLLMLIFIGALAFNIARGLDVHCGCFSTSPGQDAATIWTILRDGLFLAPALYCLIVVFSRPTKTGEAT